LTTIGRNGGIPHPLWIILAPGEMTNQECKKDEAEFLYHEFEFLRLESKKNCNSIAEKIFIQRFLKFLW